MGSKHITTRLSVRTHSVRAVVLLFAVCRTLPATAAVAVPFFSAVDRASSVLLVRAGVDSDDTILEALESFRGAPANGRLVSASGFFETPKPGKMYLVLLDETGAPLRN